MAIHNRVTPSWWRSWMPVILRWLKRERCDICHVRYRYGEAPCAEFYSGRGRSFHLGCRSALGESGQ